MSGSAMSSKKKLRKSSRESVKTKSSSPSPESLAWEPPPPPPCCWRSKLSPDELLVARVDPLAPPAVAVVEDGFEMS